MFAFSALVLSFLEYYLPRRIALQQVLPYLKGVGGNGYFILLQIICKFISLALLISAYKWLNVWLLDLWKVVKSNRTMSARTFSSTNWRRAPYLLLLDFGLWVLIQCFQIGSLSNSYKMSEFCSKWWVMTQNYVIIFPAWLWSFDWYQFLTICMFQIVLNWSLLTMYFIKSRLV